METVILALTLRLLNMAQWAVLYGEDIKLSSPTLLKWSTFNKFSMHVKCGIDQE